MIERWRRWNYPRVVSKVAASDDFPQFVAWETGPWTPAMVKMIPTPELLAGPPQGQIDPDTRRCIDLELARRSQSLAPVAANIISLLALLVAIAALFKK